MTESESKRRLGLTDAQQEAARLALSEAIRDRRFALSITQQDAALAAGISVATWGKIESGRVKPSSISATTQRGVCRALGWMVDSIFMIEMGHSPTVAAPEPTPVARRTTVTTADLADDLAVLLAEIASLRADVKDLQRKTEVRWADIEKLQTPNEEKKK